MATLSDIYNWFMTGKRPTQAQFWASWGSFYNKDEVIPQSAVQDLATTLNAKAEKAQFDGHKIDANAHLELFEMKEDKNKKGFANGYAPLNEFVKISSDFLNIVNDLVTGGATSLASAETVKTLKTQIDGINTLLASDNINLDTVQEIVDAIETVQTSLSTILVNDLTTGGVTKALTAEMGKTLKGLVDGLTSGKADRATAATSAFTAENDRSYTCRGTFTITNPAGVLNRGYSFRVVDGFVTVGTNIFPAGSNVFANFNGTTWDYNAFYPNGNLDVIVAGNITSDQSWNYRNVRFFNSAVNFTVTMNHNINCTGTKMGTGTMTFINGTQTLDLADGFALLNGARDTFAMETSSASNRTLLFVSTR